MPNADRPHGFVPIQSFGGSVRLHAYNVDAANGTAVFKNDLVMREADGFCAPATAGSVQIIGASSGALYDNAVGVAQFSPYLPASTAGTILVADDPFQLYEAQADDGTAIAAADRFLNYDHIAGAGSTRTGISAHELDSNTGVTTAAGFNFIEGYPAENNTLSATLADSEFARMIVLCVEHAFLTTTGI